MNETNNPANPSDVPWPTSVPRVGVPDTSLVTGSDSASEKAEPAAVGLLKNTVQGAHQTIDYIADRAEPAVRQLGERVSAAGETLHAKTDQLRETGDEWVEGVRTTVRSNPLTSVVAAFALGAVIARITR